MLFSRTSFSLARRPLQASRITANHGVQKRLATMEHFARTKCSQCDPTSGCPVGMQNGVMIKRSCPVPSNLARVTILASLASFLYLCSLDDSERIFDHNPPRSPLFFKSQTAHHA
ncbi:hypothetical protein BT69DRAFT_1285371 [Atractiella rhizophila]|nr:hypothetical protein BT69DRAFT_1285371 [Atractiella rhizophila]